MSNLDPLWVAPQTGHNWRDEDVLRATAWLRSFVPQLEWERRIESARGWLMKAWSERAAGKSTPLYDLQDEVAWQIFQAETYAVDRQYWVPEASAQIVPILTRIGKELSLLQSVHGVGERAARLMTTDRRQPGGGLFELLVALAYKRRGWSNVEFVPEQPGMSRTYDLAVSLQRRRWAIECKKLGVSAYAATEKECGERLAKPVHDLSLAASRSIIVEVIYHQELRSLAADHLAERLVAFLADPSKAVWRSAESSGRIRDVDWGLFSRVIRDDFVYFGSSRMIELLVGHYDHQADHCMAAKWRPAKERPFFADAVYQASVVSWSSRSHQSITRKARHFRSMIADANGQLPLDRPGAIHVGIESRGGFAVDAFRHIRNWMESLDFNPTNSRLRWVYGNYFAPEATTRRNESWALNETTVPYKIGRHSTAEPLPGHFLLTPETRGRSGVHWDGLTI